MFWIALIPVSAWLIYGTYRFLQTVRNVRKAPLVNINEPLCTEDELKNGQEEEKRDLLKDHPYANDPTFGTRSTAKPKYVPQDLELSKKVGQVIQAYVPDRKHVGKVSVVVEPENGGKVTIPLGQGVFVLYYPDNNTLSVTKL